MSLQILVLVLFFSWLMAYAAASDLVTMTIPNRLSLALLFGFIGFALWFGMPLAQIGTHLLAGLLVLCVTFSMFAAGWIGGGDAKLAAATAVWCGFADVLDYCILSSLFGGLLTVLILMARGLVLPAFMRNWQWLMRLHDKKTGIPYGIALAAAGLFVFPGTNLWAIAIGA